MLNFQDVQREIGQQHPNHWEEVWYDLAVADGFRAGVGLEAFHWDWRTSLRDGGRDLVIDRGTTHAGASFVPAVPSVWSVKSGANGVAAATLKGELNPEKHSKLVNLLKSGHTYIYCLCHPAGKDERDALRESADECAIQLGLGSNTIKLLFDNHLCDGLKLYPGVLMRHCPRLGMSNGQTLEQWGKRRPHFDTAVNYVDIADRRCRIDYLVKHLGAMDGPPVLHVAGLSGIGKTRLAYEACRDTRVPISTIYFESYADCLELVRRVADDHSLSVRFVVDEVSLDQHIDLRKRLSGFGDRVRAISIGPAGMRDESRDTIAILPPPETKSGVLAVLTSHANGSIPVRGLEYIADQSAHDLRFALLMLDAVHGDPALLAEPGDLIRALHDTESLYARVLKLFAGNTGLDADFQIRYPWLTLSAHIGVRPPREAELAFVAQYSAIPLIALDRTVSQALQYGLGDRPAHLFEAVPRGMATRLFAEVLWPVIEPRFQQLLNSAPDDSFVRSIMQRVEMCPERVKKEVTSRLDGHFRTNLGVPALAALSDYDNSRTLRSWAELSPEAGLSWLKSAIDGASSEELRAFEGSSRHGWGPLGPRRNVVWLLEHLACFEEHFPSCEAMLFKLAVAENEDIGNNATATWVEKQRVLLSNTQTPYSERVRMLMKRLALASTDTMQLLMKGFVESVTSPHSAMSPPSIIGGRLVPPEWRPVGVDIYDLFTATILQGLEVIAGLPQSLQGVARRGICSELTTFYKEATATALERFFDLGVDLDERLLLTAALEDLRDRLRDDEDPNVVALTYRVTEWLSRVSPKGLAERLQLVVGRSPWSYDSEPDAPDDEAWKGPYREIAGEVRDHLATLVELTEWFDKSAGDGAWSFGWMLASVGNDGEFDDTIAEWLKAGKCLQVCSGFLVARRGADSQLPKWATEILDELAKAAPDTAARVTVAIDPTIAGFNRLMACMAHSDGKVLESLGGLFGDKWEAAIGPSGQAWVLDRLWPEAGQRDLSAGSTALHLLRMIRHRHKSDPIPTELLPAVRRLVLSPPTLSQGHNGHTWKDLAVCLARTEPKAVIDFAAKVAIDVQSFHGYGNGEAIGVLIALAGEQDSAIVESVLDTMGSVPNLVSLEIAAWQKLFAKLDPTTVAKAVEARGVEAARAIGEFIPDPAVNPDGTALLPTVTEWYLRTFGEDEECFRQFCVGRWNGRIRIGWAWERQSAVDALVRAYATSESVVLRKWVNVLKAEHDTEVLRQRVQFEEGKRI